MHVKNSVKLKKNSIAGRIALLVSKLRCNFAVKSGASEALLTKHTVTEPVPDRTLSLRVAFKKNPSPPARTDEENGS